MPWEGEEELSQALSALKKKPSSVTVKGAASVALRHIREYKRVVHALEHFLWRSKPDVRLPGLHAIDALFHMAKGPDRSTFTKRFAGHFKQTAAAVLEIPEAQQDAVKKTFTEWHRRNYFDLPTFKDAGATSLIIGEVELQPQSPEKSPLAIDASGDKIKDLLALLKKQKEQSQERAGSTPSKEVGTAAFGNPPSGPFGAPTPTPRGQLTRDSPPAKIPRSSVWQGSAEVNARNQTGKLNMPEQGNKRQGRSSRWGPKQDTISGTSNDAMHASSYPIQPPQNSDVGLVTSSISRGQPIQQTSHSSHSDSFNDSDRYIIPPHQAPLSRHSDQQMTLNPYDNHSEGQHFLGDGRSDDRLGRQNNRAQADRPGRPDAELHSGSGQSIRRPEPFDGDAKRKTKLCTNFMQGFCRFADRCHFAHGEAELRRNSFPPKTPPTLSRGSFDNGPPWGLSSQGFEGNNRAPAGVSDKDNHTSYGTVHHEPLHNKRGSSFIHGYAHQNSAAHQESPNAGFTKPTSFHAGRNGTEISVTSAGSQNSTPLPSNFPNQTSGTHSASSGSFASKPSMASPSAISFAPPAAHSKQGSVTEVSSHTNNGSNPETESAAPAPQFPVVEVAMLQYDDDDDEEDDEGGPSKLQSENYSPSRPTFSSLEATSSAGSSTSDNQYPDDSPTAARAKRQRRF